MIFNNLLSSPWKRPYVQSVTVFVVVLIAILAVSQTARAQSFKNTHLIERLIDEDGKIQRLYWSDGDSGKINNIPFRISNADAAETGRIGLKGGAKCYEETVIGKAHRDFVRDLPRRKFQITSFKGFDRSGRALIDLSYEGQDYVALMRELHFMQDWKHNVTKALEKKPNWCPLK